MSVQKLWRMRLNLAMSANSSVCQSWDSICVVRGFQVSCSFSTNCFEICCQFVSGAAMLCAA